MVDAVALDHESRLRVVKIGPPNESTLGVMKVGLDFGTGQVGLQQQPAKTGLHRRFSRSGQLGQR